MTKAETFPLAARLLIGAETRLSDEELARRTLRGDPDAYDALIERHTPALYRLVRGMCSDRAEAEAVTQEAFLRAWEHLSRLKDGQPFWLWLARIATNAARDALKKSRPLDFADLPNDRALTISGEDPGPDELVEQADLMTRLGAALEHLPAPYRIVVALHYQAGMSYEDMALTLSLPVNTIRTHLRRAKQHLRKELEEENE